MKARTVLATLGASLLTIHAWAAPGDVAAGGEKAKLCLACHGAAGVSSAVGVPSLAGQRDQFTQWQLVFFRSGRRANPIMGPLSQTLSDVDIRDLGAYFASLQRPTGTAVTVEGDAKREQGAQLAEAHHCSSCHLDDYAGKQAAPAIAHQREEYLAKALADYRSAARPSVGVAAMTEAASGLTDEEIAALAHFLATL